MARTHFYNEKKTNLVRKGELKMNLKEIRKKRADLIKEARATLDLVEKEKRDLNEDEQKKYDEIMAEVDSLKEKIEREEKQIELEKDLKEPANEPIKNKPQESEGRKFETFGEQLKAVINASTAGAKIDPRLLEKRAAGGGLSEDVPSEGGFLVQEDFATEILKRTYETGILASRVNKIPISSTSNGLKINAIAETSRATGSRWGGIQSYWLEEAGLKVPSKPKFRQMELKLKKLIGLCYATDELLQDTTALEAIITQAFTEEFGFMIDDAIFEGDGVGKPLGIMNSGALVTVTRDTTVTIKYADIVGMWARMWARSRANSIWLINQVIEPALYAMVVGTAPAYMPAGGLSGAPYATLMGKPVIPIEQTKAMGTTGDIMLVDLGQYLAIDKGGIQTASSIHVSFLYDEQVFRFVYRVDGQPIWDSALTPFAGSTLSPYVVLSTK